MKPPARPPLRIASMPRARRATAVVGVIIALVLLQLAVTGIVVGGGRDADLSLRRLDTLRALYAAEGAMNMGVREIYRNTDEDLDGAVGSVSNNFIDSDDPRFGAAASVVTRTDGTGTTTLESQGRAGAARRRIALEFTN